MTSELFIENYRLDISADISSLITFELDNIRDFSSRGTSWSKTIVLPGTANNNKLFGHIFQIGQSNQYDSGVSNVGYNFNASVSARCLIFQDQFQTFKGVLRLMQINIIKGKTEYEVAVFGELAGLNVALSTAKLEDLDFSAYDHTYNSANVIASWDNTPGTGYFYPLIDYGQYSSLKHDWDIRTFRPALYVREYIDKMFTVAAFRWSSALFDTDRFKRLVIPHNQKVLRAQTSRVLYATMDTSQIMIDTIHGITSNSVQWDNSLAGAFSYSLGVFTYTDLATLNTNITWTIFGTRYSTTPGTFEVQIRKNGVAIASQSFNTFPVLAGFTWNSSVATTLVTGDTFDVFFTYGGTGTEQLVTIEPNSVVEIDTDTPAFVPVDVGQTTTINDAIPKNIRQIDFLSSIVKLFNLYVYEDRFDSRLIYFTPYVDFYSTNSIDSIDWTYKMNRDKALQIKPMSELNAKKYEFKFKPDSDFYNELYRKRYNQSYGDYVFDSQFEFADQTKSLELIFSGTPLVGYAGEEKIMSTIFKKSNDIEEQVDSNIRILQTKKVTGVSSWDLLDGPVTVLASSNAYGYGGHFDDPDAPSNDLNFGALRELFFVLVAGDLSVTQFNVYWSAYMAEITDKDSKLMSAWFYLKPIDILQLDFSKKIFIDGVLFRLNSIKDYNTTRPMDCQVELLKVNYLIY